MLQRMIKRSKRAGTVAAGVAATAAVVALAAPTVAWAQIRIGFMAELSGPQGALGQDQYDALMMVIERNGGKLGGVPVTVIKEDSQLKPEVAVQLVDKLIEQGQGADHHRHHLLQHHDGGPQEDHRQGGVPDRHQRRAVADRRRAVLAVLLLDVVAERPAGRGRRQVRHRQGLQEGGRRSRPTTRPARTSSPGFKRFYDKPHGQRVVAGAQHPGLLGRDSRRSRRPSRTRSSPSCRAASASTSSSSATQAGLTDKVAAAVGVHHRRHRPAGDGRCGAGVHRRHVLGTGLQERGQPASSSRISRTSSSASRRSTRPSRTTRRCCSIRRSRKVKGKLDDKEAFRAALKAADFKSCAADFKFNNNHFPIQDLHVVRGRQGRQGPDDAEDDRHAAESTRRTRSPSKCTLK